MEDKRMNRASGLSINDMKVKTDGKNDSDNEKEDERHREYQQESIASGNFAEDETELVGGEIKFNRTLTSASSATRSKYSRRYRRRRDSFGGFSTSSMSCSSDVRNSQELERLLAIHSDLEKRHLELERNYRNVKLELEEYKLRNDAYEKELADLKLEFAEFKALDAEKNYKIQELEKERKDMTRKLEKVDVWGEKRIRQIKKEMDMLLKLRRRKSESRENEDDYMAKRSSGSLSSRISSIENFSYAEESNWSASISEEHSSSLARTDSKSRVKSYSSKSYHKYETVSPNTKSSSSSSNKKIRKIKPYESKVQSESQTMTNKSSSAIDNGCGVKTKEFLDNVKLDNERRFVAPKQDEPSRKINEISHDLVISTSDYPTGKISEYDQNTSNAPSTSSLTPTKLPETLPEQWDVFKDDEDDVHENKPTKSENNTSTIEKASESHDLFPTHAFTAEVKRSFFRDDESNSCESECIEPNWGEIQLKRRRQRSMGVQETEKETESIDKGSPNNSTSSTLMSIKQVMKQRLSLPFQQDKTEASLSSGYSATRHPPPNTLLKGGSLNSRLGRRYSMVDRLNEFRANSAPKVMNPSTPSSSLPDSNEIRRRIMKKFPFAGGGDGT